MAMEMSTFATVAAIGLSLTLVNEFIIWKLWPRCAHRAATARRKAILSTLFMDPLVAAISCPMASDLYFSYKWVLSCDDFFVFTLTAVSVVLYSFSLIISHRLVATIMSPASRVYSGATARSSSKKDLFKTLPIPAWSFMLSVGVNVILTWLTLLLTHDPQVTSSYGYYDYYEPENCWTSMMERHAFFIFVLVLTMQVVPLVFYACLSQNVDSKRKQALQDESEMNILTDDINNDAECPMERRDEADSSVIVYTVTALICLIVTSVLRMGFTICSCHNYVLLANTLYYTIWLTAAKLPSAGLLYWTITSFQNRRGKS